MEESLRQAISLKASLDEADRELRAESDRIQVMGGTLVHRERLVATIGRRESIASQLRDLLNAIQECGCLVKDLDTGLLDFPTLFQGEEVYLCWKLGETSIGFWHRVSDGVRGRRPIDPVFLSNHKGED